MTNTTTFPDWVRRSIGADKFEKLGKRGSAPQVWVLVAKNAMDFETYKPDVGVDEHLAWFHSFWWTQNAKTKTKLVAFYESSQEAIEAGEKFGMKDDGYLYSWAVYTSGGVLVDGNY